MIPGPSPLRLGSLDVVIVELPPPLTPAPTRAATPLTVVLCHGFGAPATDLVDLASMLDAPPGTRFLFPAAPLPITEFGPGSRAWWRVDIAGLGALIAAGRLDDLCESEPPGLATAREALVSTLRAARERWDIPDGHLVLGGFSQGAILSADVVFRTDEALGGLILWSGMLFARDAWRAGMPRRRGLPVVISHGSADPILPYRGALLLRDELIGAGLAPRWVSFPGGHGIGPGALPATGELLATVAANAANPAPRSG